MIFYVTGNVDEQSGINDVLCMISTSIHHSFIDNQYGCESLQNLSLVLICRDPRLNFKQKIRLRKADKCLEIDIMLHLPDIIRMSEGERYSHVAKKLIVEIPEIIQKYINNKKAVGFDLARFTQDLNEYYAMHGWYNK